MLAVDRNQPHARVRRFFEFAPALVVAVKDHAARIHARPLPGKDLATGDDVEPETFLTEDADQGGRHTSLPGVDNARIGIGRRKGVANLPCAVAQRRLRHRRRAVFRIPSSAP